MIGAPLDLTAVILAGGRSRRLGGRDKGLLELAGVSLAGRVLARIEPVVRECLMSANRHESAYAALGHPVLSDAGWGPLDGLRAALEVATQPWVLAIPCDMPFFPLELPRRLLEAARREAAAVAIPTCRQNTHHAILLCRRDNLDSLAEYLANGGRSVKGWLSGVAVARVEFDDDLDFININTPEDWTQAEAQARWDERR